MIEPLGCSLLAMPTDWTDAASASDATEDSMR